MSELRLSRVLDGLGIGPSDLADATPISRTSWSKYLNEGRPIQRFDPERFIGELLEARGLPVTPDLFTPIDPDDSSEALMQGQTLSPVAKDHFKLFRDPFEPGAMVRRRADGSGSELNELYLPPEHRFIQVRIRQAATTAGFVALSGEPGSGKSTLLDSALRLATAEEGASIVRVTPANVERRKMSAAHLSAEIIRQLSERPIPHMANVRDAAAQEVLAQRYEEGQRVALVIDEAHELPHTTIKDLKRFHELRYGYAQLLAVILVGQSEMQARFNAERNYKLREAIIRCQLITLPPMHGRSPEYIARRFEWVGADVATVFEEAALEELERRLALNDQQFPVIIGNAAVAAMNIAANRGLERVTDEEVAAVWAATPEQLQRYGL